MGRRPRDDPEGGVLKRTLLIDGDIVAFKFSAASQHDIDWGDGVATSHADLEAAKANIDEHIQGLLSTLEAEQYVVALSDPDANFRKDLCPSYKAHRVGLKQPTIRRDLEAHLRDAHAAKWKPRLEGDDVLGIIATNPKLYPGTEKVIVSADKDMQTIPCVLYRGDQLRRVSREEADYYHLLQTLTGDRTDGYPGLPGVGPKKAERILAIALADFGGVSLRHDPDEEMEAAFMWSAVRCAYHAKGLTAADALLQARLARILRHEDYDYSKKEPILWNPT